MFYNTISKSEVSSSLFKSLVYNAEKLISQILEQENGFHEYETIVFENMY